MDFNALFLRTRFWIKDFHNGSPIGAPYKEIKFIQEHSYEKGLPIREKALRNLLTHAKQNTIFYKDIKGEDLKSFPIMNKSSLLEHYHEICVEKSKIPGQIGDIHIRFHRHALQNSAGHIKEAAPHRRTQVFRRYRRIQNTRQANPSAHMEQVATKNSQTD